MLGPFEGDGFEFLEVSKLKADLETLDDVYAAPRDNIADIMACNNLVRPLPKDTTRESLIEKNRANVEKLGAVLTPALGVRIDAAASS